MLARLKTFTLLGIEAVPVEVEVDVSPAAMPKTILVGLPDAAVKESTHRVERAIVNSGFIRPHDRLVINLAPGDLPKQAASGLIFPLRSACWPAAVNSLNDRSGARTRSSANSRSKAMTRPVKGALVDRHRGGQEQGTSKESCCRPSQRGRSGRRRRSWKSFRWRASTQAVAFFCRCESIIRAGTESARKVV